MEHISLKTSAHALHVKFYLHVGNILKTHSLKDAVSFLFLFFFQYCTLKHRFVENIKGEEWDCR